MIRVASGYLALSFGAPALALLLATGGNTFITAVLTLPLAVVTFAFLWLVLDVARRDNRLTRAAFTKTSAVCGLSALLLVSVAMQALVMFAPSLNPGEPLGHFEMIGFVGRMTIPAVVYGTVVGFAFWYISVRNNPYVKPEGRLFLVSRPATAAPIAAPAFDVEEKKVANL